MNSLVIILIAMAVLVAGYVFYGRWLAKKWGSDETTKTPAFTHEDGEDFVPSSKFTVFSHQFSSIAGAGPVTGPILASVFGWVPVLLWLLIGGLFFGAVQDFGALYASVKNEGKSMGMIIEKYIGKTGRKLFMLFCWLFTLLVIAAFTDMVAGTFVGTGLEDAGVAYANGSAASISMLFILVAVIFGLIQKKVGKMNEWGWPAQTVTALTVTDGKDQKANIKVSTYNYYFATTYNNMQSQQSQYQKYGLDLSKYHLDQDFDKPLSKQTTKNDDNKEVTWLEYLHDEVLETIKSNYMYYLEAVKANDGKEPKITDEQQSDIDDTMKQYKEQAHKYGYTLSAYLVKAMGRGVTEKTFRQEAKIAYIAQNYKNDLSEKKASKTYSEDDYNKYLKENRDDLVSVSIRAFECDTEDDAKAFAKALKSDGSNFTALCSAYASSDFYKKAYKSAGYSTQLDVTKTTLKNQQMAIATADSKDSTKYPGLDWLYSKDRKAGDVKQYSTSVVYVLRPVALSETKTVNVRHILIKPETNSKNTSAAQATTKQWNDAKKKAEKILAQYNSGKKTEDAFAQLAKDNSADNNAKDGGLYENVYPGQMVNSFGNWCFDSSRKSGDVAMVQTDYGYHIMYFVKQTNMPAWKYTAQQAMASSDGDADTKALEKSYSIKEHWFGSRYFEIDTDIDM